MNIVNDLALEINTSEIQRLLGLNAHSEDWPKVHNLIQEARVRITPRCGFKASCIQEKGTDEVTIDHVSFQSKVLRKNLETIDQVFPFVVTIGHQLEEKAKAHKDSLEQYYLNTIANVALQDALACCCTFLQNEYKIEQLSYMSPGSLEDWPIQQQGQLFSLLGNVAEEIGVRLAPNMLMYPSKSESGIFFATRTPFYSCQLCSRAGCPLRKAPFDDQLAQDYGLI
jgi:hypothetical protein